MCAAQHTNGKSMMTIKNILFGAKLTVNICVRDIYLNYYYEAYNYLHWNMDECDKSQTLTLSWQAWNII